MIPYKVAVAVNDAVNAETRYTTDLEQYGVPDYWEPSGASGLGDCEDYALEKRKRLGDGRLTFCRMVDGQGHLVLYVETPEKGGVILDNNFVDPVFPDELPYTWLAMLENGIWREITGFS